MLVCRITTRLLDLPLVSRRWARIMRTSVVVWRRACIELSEIVARGRVADRPGLYTDFVRMSAWFHACQGRFEQLGIDCESEDMQLAPVITGMLLSTQAGSLRSLSLNLAACGLRGHELGVVAALRELTALHVHVGGDGLDDRGVACLRAASHLPALAHLDLTDRSTTIEQRSMSLPRCQELRELRSGSLERLAVDMGGGTEDELRLARNPNLKAVCLFTVPSSIDFWLNTASFEGCTGIQQLKLYSQRSLRLQPGCFHVLSALTSLALANCGLSAVPAELTLLPSLHSLDLSRNESLDVDETGAAVLLSLKTMRQLDVAKYDSQVHSVSSVQTLFDLVETFHDDGLPLHVNFDPDLTETVDVTDFWGFL